MPTRFHSCLFSGLLLAGIISSTCRAQPQISDASYIWTNVAMGGSGAVPGVVLHPRIPDLAYIHTDVGGAYRWEAATKSWTPLLDHIPFTEWNRYGVDSIAVDPSDETGNTVYLSTGKYTDDWARPFGILMKSTDRGATWRQLPLTPTGASNNDQGAGERLAVDPQNPNIILYASRLIGLQRSGDAGESWRRIDAAPTGASPNDPDAKQRGNGLTFVLFDPSGSALDNPHRSARLYLGASGQGIHRSDDGGETWTLIPDGPAYPRKAAIGSDGTLLVTYGGGVACFTDGQWSDITPEPNDDKNTGSCGVAIDPRNPRHFLVTKGGGHYAKIFRSLDAGQTWCNITGKRNNTLSWWPTWHWISNPFSLAFDFHRPNRVWLTDWYGTYLCEDITADSPVWTNYVKGHEEIVTVGALVAPASGKYQLLSGAADIGGLDHESLDTPPEKSPWNKGLPNGLTRTGLAINRARPNFVVTVGTINWNDPGNGGYSLDGGDTWTVFPSLPYDGIRGGRVISPGKDQRILWAPQKGEPYFSDDLGRSWRLVQADVPLKAVAHGEGIFVYDQPLAVDRANPNRVYLLHDRQLLRSDNAGARFKRVSNDLPDHYLSTIDTPGVAGEIWLAAGEKGLYRSMDGGESFSPVVGVAQADLFCFGKAPPGKSFPAIFVKGKVDSSFGYFRSDDRGATWLRLDNQWQRVGNDPNTMTADWRVFGRVYVGTNGRGIFVGTPATK